MYEKLRSNKGLYFNNILSSPMGDRIFGAFALHASDPKEYISIFYVLF
jgi:hypothetical protein